MVEQYQPEWVNGRAISQGVRACEDRWEIISSLLAQYSRPFTILDLGANLGYFSLRVTETFDCVAVAVEHGYADWLGEILRRNDARNVLGLDHRVTARWLKEVGEVEHFDVVLALSFTHHLAEPYGETLELLRRLGDHVIVEPATEPQACGPRVDEPIPADGTVLGHVSSHLGGVRPVVHLRGMEYPRRQVPWIGAPKATDVRIWSDFEEKRVVFPRKGEERRWRPGINLHTFLTSGGFWPSRTSIAETLPYREGHGDIRPWNYILGDGLTLIDAADPRHEADLDDRSAYAETRAAVLA